MIARQPSSRLYATLPQIWLLTDERMDEPPAAAAARLPKGRAGIIFRHYATDKALRKMLFNQLRRVARARRLPLLLAGSPAQARAWRADGWHDNERAHPFRAPPALLHSRSAHGMSGLIGAARAGADFILLSPVFPTRSHPGTRTLGPLRLALLARQAKQPVIALGGMNKRRFAAVRRANIHGYAAIDALTRSAG